MSSKSTLLLEHHDHASRPGVDVRQVVSMPCPVRSGNSSTATPRPAWTLRRTCPATQSVSSSSQSVLALARFSGVDGVFFESAHRSKRRWKVRRIAPS